MVKKTVWWLFILAITFVFVGCTKEKDVLSDYSDETVALAKDFILKLPSCLPVVTKSGEVTENDAHEMIEPLLASSIAYLNDNGYDCLDDFESLDDPRITWVALSYAELVQIGIEPDSGMTIGECALVALGLDEFWKKKLSQKAAKKAIKLIASKTLAKCIPYVGEVLIAVDFAYCVYNERPYEDFSFD